jgi:hypothetical protein
MTTGFELLYTIGIVDVVPSSAPFMKRDTVDLALDAIDTAKWYHVFSSSDAEETTVAVLYVIPNLPVLFTNME